MYVGEESGYCDMRKPDIRCFRAQKMWSHSRSFWSVALRVAAMERTGGSRIRSDVCCRGLLTGVAVSEKVL